jgi:hypothetical protein
MPTHGGTVKRFVITFAACHVFALPAMAQRKPCEELKVEIAAKLDAKGVKNYTLNIVAAGEVKDAKVIGTCEGGTKRITYERK